ncbi:MAG: thiosulfate oxidation carrier protein SoxY [Candidatus Sedimenticola sp. (ex Thyasira tokunagai)]
MKRRIFLKGSMAVSALGIALGAGLLTPTAVLAAWPDKAFHAKKMSDALNALLGSDAVEESSDITIDVPEIAENGNEVPVKVISTIADIESISIFAEKNPSPLVATFNLADNAQGFVSTRIRMGGTANVVGVVKAGGKVYSAKKEVKVTVGGCGG